MNKTELCEHISEKSGLSRTDAEKALNAFIETITEGLSRNDAVQLVGFGTFAAKKRAARQGRNPRSGETIKIPARNVPHFKAGSKLKEAVNM